MSHADLLPGEPVEIERKFLVTGDAWRGRGRVETIRQGYLPTAADCTVRVRIVGDRGFLTVKSVARGGVRAEIELDRIDRPIELPLWVGREVTGDPRYLNGSLATAVGPPVASGP